jgi:hypothetical protein
MPINMHSIPILLALATLSVAGQAQDNRPGAPAPHMNGKPDLSGLWEADRTPVAEFARVLGNNVVREQVDINDSTKEGLNVFWGVKPNEKPLQPAGLAALKQHEKMTSPSARCLPEGVPAGMFFYPSKFVQAPGEVVILSGTGDPARQIYTDGRAIPNDLQPSWMGYSVGKWQGDTLAVETTGFKEESWLDGSGHPRSESMHIRENYHRRDFGHLDVEITFDDPKYYTRPFSLNATFHLITDGDVLEFLCSENEKDRAHSGQH